MSHYKVVNRTLIMIMFASAISACGFHLRGSIPLPAEINNMFVDARNGPFKDQMEEILEGGGATIATTADVASSRLVILESQVEKTVGTLDERGKANSYLLQYRVSYDLLDSAGTKLRSSVVNEDRRYDFDPDTVLETESEEEELIIEMEESIALRILRQLATVSVNPTSPATKTN